MKILVTGGAGFVGSNFIFYAIKNHPEDKIICLDKLTYAGNLTTLASIIKHPNFSFVQGDICDDKFIDKLFFNERPDVVINFAAESHVDRSIDTPKLFMKTNAMGTLTLLQVCRKYNIKRFHQISTDEVYGDMPLESINEGFIETTNLNSNNPYSSSKASADILAMAFYKTYGLPVTISRCTNNYGPYQFPEKLIPLMITRALLDKPLPIYGNGLNVRSWIHVTDHCSAIDLIIRKGKPGNIYNVSGKIEMSNLDVVKNILLFLNKSFDLIDFVADRRGHDRKYSVCCDKIKQELGWEERFVFLDGLKDTISWYSQNKSWWEVLL